MVSPREENPSPLPSPSNPGPWLDRFRSYPGIRQMKKHVVILGVRSGDGGPISSGGGDGGEGGLEGVPVAVRIWSSSPITGRKQLRVHIHLDLSTP
jgi:hypothetical protein